MQLKLSKPDALTTAFVKMATLEEHIKRSENRCDDLEGQIAELQLELDEEKSYLADLGGELKEADKRLERLGTLDDLSNPAVRRWFDDHTVLYSDIWPIEDGMIFADNPYTLTNDRWEIATACSGTIPNEIGFGLIWYEKFIPIAVWGGEGFAHPDSLLKLLYCSRIPEKRFIHPGLHT